MTVDDEETKSDEFVKEVKAKAAKATKVVKEKTSHGRKKSKSSDIDEVIKQGKFIVELPMSLK